MMRTLARATAPLTIGVLLLAGCGSDAKTGSGAATTTAVSSSADEKAIQGTIRALLKAEQAKDTKAFLAIITDKGLAGYDAGTRAEIQSGDSGFGEDPPDAILGFIGTKAEGGTGTTTVDVKAGKGLYRVVFTMLKQGDAWLIDGFDFKGSPPPEPGQDVLDVKAVDYGYVFDPGRAASGTFAGRFTNTGKEQHEITMFEIPAGATVDDARKALQDVPGDSLDKNIPAGYTLFDHVTFAEVGQAVDFRFADPLPKGHYAIMCFLPQGGLGDQGPNDPNGKPHIQLGMIADFTVR